MLTEAKIEAMADSIPRRVWIFWDSGFDAAPEAVKVCLDSWESQNPEWEIIRLSRESLSNYLDPDTIMPGWHNLPIQQQSDFIRLELLAQHGGIWVDATLFCAEPLSDWVPVDPSSGFVVFDVPTASDKFFGSYFIAASAESFFVRKWAKLFRRYLATIPPRMSGNQTKRLRKLFPPLRTKIGQVLFTTRVFRQRFGTPYFAIHYIGTRLLMTSPRAFLLWRRRPHMVSGKFSTLLKAPSVARQFQQDLAAKRFGAWKLTHKPLPDQVDALNEVLSVARQHLASKRRSGS